MSGISPNVLFNANILYVTFADDIGNVRHVQGTGFWIKRNTEYFFVTNAHNINPSMKLGNETKLKLFKLEVELRTSIGEMTFNTTLRHELIFSEDTLKMHATADVAIFKYLGFKTSMGNYNFAWFQTADLADHQFFNNKIQPMDIASFIGFPGKTGVPWYDEQWKLAVARVVNIASFPRLGFSNRNIPTTDAVLVSGLSFSGSSGSPVISHEKGLQLGEGLTGGNYMAPKLIGIMSGHWWNEEAPTDAFRHSGLSYLTRSTSILETLALF